MGEEGFTAIVTKDFGGENKFAIDAQQNEDPYAVDAANVQFGRGGVRTRAGLNSASLGNSISKGAILSIKEYVLLDNTKRRTLLCCDGASVNGGATCMKETGSYSWSSFWVSGGNGSRMKMNSATGFGREYFGFTQNTSTLDGVAFDTPRAFDDTNSDPVAPSGPGAGPTVADGAAGSIAAGAHSWRVCYRTRNGYITAPGPATVFTAAGSKVATITAIPLGPTYVVGRIICMTPMSNSSDYYFVAGGAMDIRDNTSTTATVDVTDAALIAGTQISVRSSPTSDLANCINLPQQAGAMFYHNRVGWYGEQTSIPLTGDLGFLNMSFDGGWAAGNNVPLGWTEKTAGETRASAFSSTVADTGTQGDGLKIAGTGVNNPVSVLQNNGTFLAIVPSGVALSARVRLRNDANNLGITGDFYVYFCTSATAANTLPTNYGKIANSSLNSVFTWQAASILPASANTLTSSYVLRFGVGLQSVVGDSLANNDFIYVDRIEIYETAKPYSPSLIRWSRAGQPDAYDALYGIMQVGINDGQKISGGFQLGENFYIVKDRSLYVVRDDGSTEPSSWTVGVISSNKGSPSTTGFAVGDRWAVIASRSGLHYFDGSNLVDISTDQMRETWRTINWQYAWRVNVSVDTERRRITVAVPLSANTTSKTILSMEYFGDNPLSGQRKWSHWTMANGWAFSAQGQVERSDGTRANLIAMDDGLAGLSSGQLTKIDDTANTDLTATGIVSSYRFAYHGPREGRGLWGKLTANVSGNGTFSIVGYLPDNVTTVAGASSLSAPNIALNTAPGGAGVDYPWDIEWTVDVTAERVSWQVGTVAGTNGHYFLLNRFTEYVRPKPWSRLRGLRGSS